MVTYVTYAKKNLQTFRPFLRPRWIFHDFSFQTVGLCQSKIHVNSSKKFTEVCKAISSTMPSWPTNKTCFKTEYEPPPTTEPLLGNLASQGRQTMAMFCGWEASKMRSPERSGKLLQLLLKLLQLLLKLHEVRKKITTSSNFRP